MRIAQITDFHLRHHLPGSSTNNPNRSRRIIDLLPEALRQIKNQDVDFIAVTGDLVDVPIHLLYELPEYQQDCPEAYQEAGIKDYQLLKDLLDSSEIPYMVLPGNHDDERLMWQVFDRSAHEAEINGYRILRFTDREYHASRPHRFDPHRERFENALADDTMPQIHLQHYVITPHIEHWYPHNYADAANLLHMTTQTDHVRLSLSGHYHPGSAPELHHKTIFAACPAFCRSPFQWRVYDLNHEVPTMEEHSLFPNGEAKRPGIVLDRDGVINTLGRYRGGVELMELIPGSAEAIRKLNQAGFGVFTLSNQVGVGRGYYPLQVVEAVTDKLARLLAEHGAYLDGAYLALGAGDLAAEPRYVDESKVKPQPTLVHQAAHDLNLDLSKAIFVGDRTSDMECALNAKIKPVFVRTGFGPQYEHSANALTPTLESFDNLAEVVDWYLNDYYPNL